MLVTRQLSEPIRLNTIARPPQLQNLLRILCIVRKKHGSVIGTRQNSRPTSLKWRKSGKKLIDKKKCPPRSLDLNPCDFFLWGYLKQRVYNPLPKTLEDLQSNIVRELENIPVTMLKATFLNFRKRCELLISAGGGHIE